MRSLFTRGLSGKIQTLGRQTTAHAAYFPARPDPPRHARIHHQRMGRAAPLDTRLMSGNISQIVSFSQLLACAVRYFDL